MEPGDESFDDELGAEIKPRHLANHLGLQVFLGSARQERSPRICMVWTKRANRVFTPTRPRRRAEWLSNTLPRRPGEVFASMKPPKSDTHVALRSYFGVSGSLTSLRSLLIKLSVVCPSAWA